MGKILRRQGVHSPESGPKRGLSVDYGARRNHRPDKQHRLGPHREWWNGDRFGHCCLSKLIVIMPGPAPARPDNLLTQIKPTMISPS
jgi:hypothetical protein